jgi:OOP family OmpA-OmpF porin
MPRSIFFSPRTFPITLAVAATIFAGGCSTKSYVRNQTAPLIQKTNELDDVASANARSIRDVDQRAQSGIAQAQQSANAASQNAQAADQSANQAKMQAQEAFNRADSLEEVIQHLDTYKPVSDVAVMFAFDKADLTRAGKADLDQLGAQLVSTKSYILELTGGTDSVGSKEYNYDLSQRRASAVAQYLASKYNIPPRIGKDKEVASNNTAAGRAKNRRVEIQLLSNDAAVKPSGTAVSQVRP